MDWLKGFTVGGLVIGMVTFGVMAIILTRTDRKLSNWTHITPTTVEVVQEMCGEAELSSFYVEDLMQINVSCSDGKNFIYSIPKQLN